MQLGTLTRDGRAEPGPPNERLDSATGGTAGRSPWGAWSDQCQRMTGPLAIAAGFSIPISTTLTEIVLSALGVCWLLGGEFRQRLASIVASPIARGTLALFALYALTLAWTAAPMPEAVRMLMKHRPLLYVGVFLTIFVNERLWRRGLRAFECGMLLTLAVGFLISFEVIEPLRPGPQTGAVFKNHIAQNVMMAFLAFLLAHRCLDAPRNGWLYGLLALLTSYNVLFMVGGRTGHVALAALVFLFLCQRMTSWKLALGTAVALLAAGVTYSTSENLRHRFDLALTEAWAYATFRAEPEAPTGKVPKARNTSIGKRLSFYEASLSVARDRPAFGHGVGSFRTVYSFLAAEHGLPPCANPHNEYLLALVQAGIPGVVVLLILFAALWIVSRRLDGPLKWAAQGLVVIFAMNCLFNSMLFDTTEGHFFAYIAGLCAGQLASLSGSQRRGVHLPDEDRPGEAEAESLRPAA